LKFFSYNQSKQKTFKEDRTSHSSINTIERVSTSSGRLGAMSTIPESVTVGACNMQESAGGVFESKNPIQNLSHHVEDSVDYDDEDDDDHLEEEPGAYSLGGHCIPSRNATYAESWRHDGSQALVDVAIVGGGACGLAVAIQ